LTPYPGEGSRTVNLPKSWPNWIIQKALVYVNNNISKPVFQEVDSTVILPEHSLP
jgi:hypothetical protein